MIEMELCDGPAKPERLHLVQDIIGITFPKEYIEIISSCDGGIPIKSSFEFLRYNRIMGDCVGLFLPINPQESGEDILNIFLNPPEFFPKGLVAFAPTGCGDFICFDYRLGKHLTNPPIIFWEHGADDGEDIFFLAENFEAFLEMLKENGEDA